MQLNLSASTSDGTNARSERSAIRWLMLGCGAIARECFLPAFERLKCLDRLTVVDLSIPSEVRAQYADVTFLEGDFRSLLEQANLRLLANSGVTAAVVALPNDMHEEAVSLLLARRMHVLCEKPLALSESVCVRLQKAADEAERLLAVNMIRRLFPSLGLARRLIDHGFLGVLTRIEIEHGGPFAWPVQSLAPFLPANGGVFADMGIHYLDLAESLVGTLTLDCYRDDWCGGVEAEAVAKLRSEIGVYVDITLSRLRKKANTIKVIGSNGSVVIGVDSLASVTFFSANDPHGLDIRPLRDGAVTSHVGSFADCFVKQLQEFSRSIESGVKVNVDGVVAARTVRVVEEAYQKRPSVTRSDDLRTVLSRGAVLVTGATGFVGTHLIERLFQSGFTEVSAAIRRPTTCAPIARFPVHLRPTDLLSLESVRSAIRGKRFVFHLAYGRDGAHTELVTVEGTRNVVEAAIEAGCEAVVILSTINVFGWPEGDTDESAGYKPCGGTYGRSKARMEKWCLERATRSGGTRITVLLPSCVYGPGGKTFTELPVRLARDGAFGWISGGTGLANYVFIDNLVDAMMFAAAKPDAHGQRFIISDGWAPWREFLSPVLEPWLDSICSYEPGDLKRLEREGRRGSLKRAVRAIVYNEEIRREINRSPFGPTAKFLATRARIRQGNSGALKEEAGGPKRGHPPPWIEDLFGPFRTRFSSDKARSALGWQPDVALEEGHKRSVAYLQDFGFYAQVQCPA